MINLVKNLIRKYFVGGFLLFFPQATAIFISLITLPIILANLEIKDYGMLQFILALQLWLVTLTARYITLGARRGISRGLDGTFFFAFFSRLKFLILLTLLVFLGAFFVYYAGFITLSLLLVIISAFLVLGYLPQVSYLDFFIAKKQFKNYAIWQTIASVLVPIVSALAAFLTHNILIFAIIQFGSAVLISLTGFCYVIVKNNLYSAYKKEEIDRACFSYGLKLMPASLISETSNKITSFMIGPFFGFANLAVFSIALKLEEKFRSPIKSLHNLLYSDFTRIKQKDLILKIKPRLRQGLFISFAFALICVFFGYLYIDLFLPESYQTAKLYILILGLGLPAVVLQMIIHTILAANLRYKELTALIILPNFLKILLIIILGFLFKVIGICFAVALGNWISFGSYYLLTMKKNMTLKLINRIPLLKKLSNF